MAYEKKPLYRKKNTKAHGVHHNFGGDFSTTKKNQKNGMSKGVQRGLDYTPLFKFLLSKVGEDWTKIHSEALSRLDKEEPIYWMVSLNKETAKDYIRVGESSYYSGLYVDENNKLQITATEINNTTLEPSCKCCTHTFNGIKFSKKYTG